MRQELAESKKESNSDLVKLSSRKVKGKNKIVLTYRKPNNSRTQGQKNNSLKQKLKNLIIIGQQSVHQECFSSKQSAPSL